MALVQGSYRKVMTTGSVSAGLSAASLIYGFRWAPTPSTLLCAIRRVAVTGSVAGTAFAATGPGLFTLFPVRPYTTLDVTGATAGTFAGANNKLKSSFPTTAGVTCAISTTAAISGGTGGIAQDTDALAILPVSCPTSTNSPFTPYPAELFRVLHPDDTPLILYNLEGFVIKATVPGTGVWTLNIEVNWDELAGY